MILSAILILSATASAISTITLASLAEIRRMMKAEIQRRGIPRYTAVVIVSRLCSLAVAVLWVLYAVRVDDWRFGAIGVIPGLLSLIESIAHSTFKPRTRKEPKP